MIRTSLRRRFGSFADRSSTTAGRWPALHPALALLLAACGTAGPTDSGAQGSCPVPVCRYAGTAQAETQVGDEMLDRGKASVVWTFSHMDGREAVYLATGRVTAAWHLDRCSVALEPAEHALTNPSPEDRHTRLRVDFTRRPIRYSATGNSEWAGTQRWTCPGGAPWTNDGVSTTWLSALEMTSHDPGLLEGTVTTETGRSSWSFVNSP